MLQLRFHHTIAKEAGEPNSNEDYYRPKHSGVKGPFVLSDGASESYDARTWSRILVKRYHRSPQFTPDWVRLAAERYAEYHLRRPMSWSQEAAYQRGSFATLLAIDFSQDGTQADILSIGDSLILIGKGDNFFRSFPYSSPEQFSDHPMLISTRFEQNKFMFDDDPSTYRTSWALSGEADIILAMTDALGAWTLTDPKSRFHMLSGLRSRDAFSVLIRTERAGGRIRRDDTTLLIFTG